MKRQTQNGQFRVIALTTSFIIVICVLVVPVFWHRYTPVTKADDAITLSFVYSPEKAKWLQDRIEHFNQMNRLYNGHQIWIEGTVQSSGDARASIRDKEEHPVLWSPSSTLWLAILKEESGNPGIAQSATPLVNTPVVISMWKPMAQALGWPNAPIGWDDILALVKDPQGWGAYGHPEWGRFTWGHTDPEVSTTAVSTILAEFQAATHSQQTLSLADIQSSTSQQFMRDLGQGIKHYGPNTLVFTENMAKFGMSFISAFPVEEATMIAFNQGNPAPPPTPLVAIYPKDGTYVHDNPLIVMADASREQQNAARIFQTYLLSDASQRAAIANGFRSTSSRFTTLDPMSASYGANPAIPVKILPLPPADVIKAAKDAWRQNRKRADIVLDVDVSGSMEGDKLTAVKAGLETFLSQLLPDDRVGLAKFSDSASLVVPVDTLATNRIALDDAIGALQAGGATAIFDSIIFARDALVQAPPMTEDRIRAIVLLTDGGNNRGSYTSQTTEDAMKEAGVSIFPIAYGQDAEVNDLQHMAEYTHTILIRGDIDNIGKILMDMSQYF